MSERKRSVTLRVDGEEVEAAEGQMLATVLVARGLGFRRSVQGEIRQPLCAMGTCFECRVTVDGAHHVRACKVVCRDGLDVRTAGPLGSAE